MHSTCFLKVLIVLFIAVLLTGCQVKPEESTHPIDNQHKIDSLKLDQDIYGNSLPYTIDVSGDTLFKTPEVPATYSSGNENLYKHLAQLLKGKYPDEARRHGIEGRVMIKFVVDESGNALNPRVVKGIGSGCDEVALEAFKQTGSWNPGRQYGRPVKTEMVIPIVFNLQ